MRPTLPLTLRMVLVFIFLTCFAITLVHAAPSETSQQTQLRSQAEAEATELLPALATPLPLSTASRIESQTAAYSHSWRTLLRSTWDVLVSRPGLARVERNGHVGRRGRYLRRGRAHP